MSPTPPRALPASGPASRPAPGTPDFVLHDALRCLDGSLEGLREVADQVLEDAPRHVAAVRAALARADAPAVRQAAHSLRGMLACVAAASAVEQAQALESAGLRGDLDDGPAQLEALEQALVRFRRALDAALAGA